MHRPSHLRMKPQPLENNQTHCRANYHTRKRKERRNKKKKYTTQRLTYDLSAKLHQMTEDNSSWFGNLLVSSVFFSKWRPPLRRKWQFQPEEIITRKNFTDPNCMFCFCVSMQLHISNTEHVLCAGNDYKLQELTFKCLNLYFVRVIRTLKGGIEGLQILFYVWFEFTSWLRGVGAKVLEIVSWPFGLGTAVLFVSMIMVRSMSQTTERFNLC